MWASQFVSLLKHTDREKLLSRDVDAPLLSYWGPVGALISLLDYTKFTDVASGQR